MKKIVSAFAILFLLISPIHTFAALSNDITIKAKSAILFEATTSTILYEKNAEEAYYPASLTKIATAIYTIEHADLSEIVTVSKNARRAKGTRVYLEEGEQVSLLKLVQGLLINSGNDAGIAIAEHLEGTEEVFANKLTNYVQTNMNATQTTFKNSTGLFDENHKTTAKDLALITQYAMNNELFMEMFGAQTLPWVGESWNTTIVSHHRILNGELSYEGITGGKTGYVPESGFTLASTAQRDDLHLIAIVLDGGRYDIYRDTIKLFNFGFGNFSKHTIEENTLFNFNQIKYINETPITYLTEKDYPTQSIVAPTGILHIVNNDGQIIKSSSLKAIRPIPQFNEPSMSSLQPPLPEKESSNAQNIGVLLSLIVVSIIFISRIK